MAAALISRNVHIDNLIFTIINYPGSFNIEQYLASDAIIMALDDEVETKRIVKLFRSHNSPEYFLKPVFLVQSGIASDPVLKQLADGILSSLADIADCVPKVKALFLRTVQLNSAIPHSFEARIIKKALDYMYVRDRINIAPHIDISSPVGFTWPELSVHLSFEDEHKLLQILATAEKEELLQASFYDRVYLCNNCDSGHLIYRETCSYCSSADIYTEDLIHHFPCAQIAPMSDFKKSASGTLTCPKCNKNLRHIGVDYDKPSAINHCNTCNRSSQDAVVKAKCLLCKHETEVQYLEARKIYSYKITTKGHQATLNGTLKLNNHIELIEGCVDRKTYAVLLQYLLERSKNNQQQESQLGIYTIENSYQLHNQLGNTAYTKLLGDIVRIMREYMRSSDLMAVENEHIIHVCINDVNEKQVKVIDDTLMNKITRMVKDNCDFELILKSGYQTLLTQNSVEQQLDQLSKTIFK